MSSNKNKKSNTPICDFVRNYARSKSVRLHMPGHKGRGSLGFEQYDITEIAGADSLYEADGIIAESESIATEIFGSKRTLFSTEGSSQCIRAMLSLIMKYAKSRGEVPRILAARNAHKAFITAVGLLDIDIDWLTPHKDANLLSARIDISALDEQLKTSSPTALYITSPDYLGVCADVGQIAEICHRHGVLLAVDNAHGAYLKLLSPSRHPIDLGADICCDSAHKTLPALTGAAYLHLSKSLPTSIISSAKDEMALFGSTSPSYLILQSLDSLNGLIFDGYRDTLGDFLPKVESLKGQLSDIGYTLIGDEPLKITILTKDYGYFALEVANHLAKNGIVCEFSDKDALVLMLSPENGDDLQIVFDILSSLPRKMPITDGFPKIHIPKKACSVREAMLSNNEILPVNLCEGRILAATNVACPPAIPIAVCGEIIDKETINLFKYYGIEFCRVLLVSGATRPHTPRRLF